MENLKTCLNLNKNLLGDHYQKLGVAERRGLFKYKVLLSYDKKAGWNVVRFNTIALFFRSLGFYKSTHLENIHKAWAYLKIAEQPFVDRDLDKKILDLCKRHLLVALGSVDLSDAEIICFAEANHTDKVFRYTIGLLIDTLYKEGDVILVEAYKAGRILTSLEKRLDRPFVKGHQVAQGWDFIERREPDFLKNWTQQLLKLQQLSRALVLTNPLIDTVCEHNSNLLEIEKAEQKLEAEFTDENFSQLKQAIDRVYRNQQEVNSLSAILYSGTPFERIRAWSEDLLKEFHERAAFFSDKFDSKKLNSHVEAILKEKESLNSGEECVRLLKIILSNLTKKLFEISDKAIYKGATREDLNDTLKTFGVRQTSLSEQMALLKQQGIRHIFTQVGRAHLLFNKSFPKREVQIVRNTLQQHKYIIITPKKPFIKGRLQSLNPELTRRPL